MWLLGSPSGPRPFCSGCICTRHDSLGVASYLPPRSADKALRVGREPEPWKLPRRGHLGRALLRPEVGSRRGPEQRHWLWGSRPLPSRGSPGRSAGWHWGPGWREGRWPHHVAPPGWGLELMLKQQSARGPAPPVMERHAGPTGRAAGTKARDSGGDGGHQPCQPPAEQAEPSPRGTLLRLRWKRFLNKTSYKLASHTHPWALLGKKGRIVQ